MRIRIGCVDGNTYESDYQPDSVIQEAIDESGGFLFTGDLADKRITTVEEALDEMLGMFKHDARNHTQVVNFTTHGIDRTFNVEHIVWFEYELDKDNV